VHGGLPYYKLILIPGLPAHSLLALMLYVHASQERLYGAGMV